MVRTERRKRVEVSVDVLRRGDTTMLYCCNCAKKRGWLQGSSKLYVEFACEQCQARWPEIEAKEKERQEMLVGWQFTNSRKRSTHG